MCELCVFVVVVVGDGEGDDSGKFLPIYNDLPSLSPAPAPAPAHLFLTTIGGDTADRDNVS